MTTPGCIAVVGATGYVGGRLVPRLLELGYPVVAISRSIQKLRSRVWARNPAVTLRSADVTRAESILAALEGCQRAFYLVHSMDPSNRDFADTDRRAARCFAQAAETVGLEHIIYLGGLGHEETNLSEHLRSRAEVSKILQAGAIPVTTLRAAMIIGSGRASFEMLRYLVDRLPVMITPGWVKTISQPIAIRNVLNYLMGCLTCEAVRGRTYDIGGPDVLSYRALMDLYADAAGLPRRFILPLPGFKPWLSAYWISLITPVNVSLARPLVEGLRNPAVCRENEIRTLIPQELLSCQVAIQLALRNSLQHDIETHWSDAGYLPPEETSYPGDSNWSGGTLYCDRRSIVVQGSQAELWHHIVRIGGQNGYYYGMALWRLRGIMDRLVGGPGDQRGRRDPEEVYAGDALDFWRVLAVAPNQRLRLLAEMKVPGIAILDFQLSPYGQGQTRLVQTAWFVPRGLLGLLYWLAVTPLHNFVFTGMLNGIAKAAGLIVVRGPEKLDGPADKAA
ncbi:SDR family oxidoreductase [bacterium CPR1]|nr:SDR family oxidoreductase [bacterium CPR1]